MSGFIGIHIGAGNYSEKKRKLYKNLCAKACKKGIAKLKAGVDANEVVAEVIAILENSPLTNAGFGSNLNWDGEVECDASIMDGTTLCYGAVGSVNGVKNPIKLAYALSSKSQENLALGRIPPSFLVGNGAKDFAKNCNIEIVDPHTLITEKAKKNYYVYKKRLEKYQKYEEMGSLDTVGAVCIDSKRRISAGCSSGGIALKHAGRVGQAGVFGCGCWADSNGGIATSTSGVGEYIIRTTLAKTIAQDIQNATVFPAEALQHSMTDKFLNSSFLADCDWNNKQAGTIVLKYNSKEDFGEFLWSHSTVSMSIAYMSSQDQHPHFSISRLPIRTEAGTSVVIEGVLFKY